MPQWRPMPEWAGSSAFIIGGGPSLKTFDWNLLESEMTIGCNDAFKLGVDICKICIFGDVKWFRIHKQDLEIYHNNKGVVFTNSTQLQRSRIPWLWLMPRKFYGLHTEALGWNSNTGAVAVNLALILGASPIYLLGFDMHESKEGKPNWHEHRIEKHNGEVYNKFLKGFDRVAIDLKKKFPSQEVINVTKDSALDVFPKMDSDKFWERRMAC